MYYRELVNERVLRQYADLIVSVGANVQPDQVLAVEAAPEAQPFVLEIVRRAYEKGARYVEVMYFDADVKRLRNELAHEDTLGWVPPWLGRRMLDLGDLDAARIVLTPVVPPGLLEGVDPARTAKDRLPTVQELFKLIDERSVAWTISPYPSRRWAQGVYPEADPDEAVERLWHDVVHVCRLDEPDPAAAGNERIEQIFDGAGRTGALHPAAHRTEQIFDVASRIDALDLDALHFEGPGTDLTVGLLPSSRFAKEGGASHTRAGGRHVPKLPTEGGFAAAAPGRRRGG